MDENEKSIVSSSIQNIPELWKYQRRSKRVFTVWIKRPIMPEYFKYRQSYNSDIRWYKPNHPYVLGHQEEVQYYTNIVNKMEHFKAVACYPSPHWVHLTVEINPTIDVGIYNKLVDNQLVIHDQQFDNLSNQYMRGDWKIFEAKGTK